MPAVIFEDHCYTASVSSDKIVETDLHGYEEDVSIVNQTFYLVFLKLLLRAAQMIHQPWQALVIFGAWTTNRLSLRL